MKNSTNVGSLISDDSIKALAKELHAALSQEAIFEPTRDKYVQDLNTLNASTPPSYIKYKSLIAALEIYKKEYSERKNTFGTLISREIVQDNKNKREILLMQIQQTQRELDALIINKVNEIQDHRNKLELITYEKNKLEKNFDKQSKLLFKYRTFVHTLSIAELEIDGSTELFQIVPRKYQSYATHEIVTPESKLGSLVLRGKVGESKVFQKSDFGSSLVVIRSTNPPDFRFLESLVQLIESNARKKRDVLPMARDANSGRWRDHGRENDQVLFCEFCGPHSVYTHNDGCER